jgi:hypothetical protein
MFKLHRHRSSDRPGERYEFRFSNFRAVQVCPSPPLLSLSPIASSKLVLDAVKLDSIPFLLLYRPVPLLTTTPRVAKFVSFAFVTTE